MKEIPLTKGKVALVDDEDEEFVSMYAWYAMETEDGSWYAVYKNGPTCLLMHRAILGVNDSNYVDHRNGNGLDNRRENLRDCTPTQNHMNVRKRAGTTSRYKGVCWYPNYNKWRATINAHYRQRNIGYFLTENEAALAYNAAALELFGEFAWLNVIEEEP